MRMCECVCMCLDGGGGGKVFPAKQSAFTMMHFNGGEVGAPPFTPHAQMHELEAHTPGNQTCRGRAA